MKPTIENLNDPEWWDLNAPIGSSYYKDGSFYRLTNHGCFRIKHDGKQEWINPGAVPCYDGMHKRPHPIYDHNRMVKMSDRYPAYFKDVSSLDEVDVYAVHDIFGIDDPSGCIQHASKKLLLCAKRTGGKDVATEIKEARDTLTRKLQLMGVE